MAGFPGRDIYFCEPYRPYAWPVEYMQSIDYRWWAWVGSTPRSWYSRPAPRT
ncbi:MAG: hypothetical protein MZV65_39460 [Chromatiales bacterium]|nr:hypothetical protein [Chromatiales bacterium]